MSALPYVTAPGNVEKALLGIKAAATPENVTQDFVKTILKIKGGSGNQIASYLKKIGFPVYALGIVPSTSVHHYRFAGSNIPVTCDGVEVKAGDIIAADQDGVVVVPKADAAKVLELAQEMDFKEHSMYPYIEKLKSVQEAVKKFGRL